MKPRICWAAEAPTVYEAARRYAALGLSVLPCRGKKPAVHWTAFQRRPPAPETIQKWHDYGMLENVGIICGRVSGGLVVLDLDGMAAVEAFLDQFGTLADTFTVQSGSGQGMHLYYACTDVPSTTRATGIEQGNVELRSDGCYVIAPPSIHPSGKPYRVIHEAPVKYLDNMRPVVHWIRLLLRCKREGYAVPMNSRAVIHPTAYGAAALRSEAEDVHRAKPGERNERLYRAALKMGSLIADGKLDRATVEQVLLDAARGLSESDGEAATRRTIDSGINNGMESSRERYHHLP